MRAVFGVLGLVVALALVGWLARAQLASNRQAVPALSVPGAAPASAPATVREQSQQIQQQFKQSVEAAMQQARPVPDDQ